MNIKQQKQVKKFLFEEFWQEKGSKVFLKIMRTTDLQESTQNHTKDTFDVTIKKFGTQLV